MPAEPDGGQGHAPRALLAGAALALLATVVWSGGFLLARGLRTDVPPIALNFWRWTVATVAVAPFTLSAVRRSWLVVRRHWGYLLGTAALGVSVYNTLVYVAGHTTQAVNLSLIGVAGPIFIVVLARIVDGEPITGRRVVGIVLAVAGVAVLVSGGSVTALSTVEFHAGDVWMLAATAVFAGYTMLVRRRPAELPPSAFLLAVFAAGTGLVLPAYLIELAVRGPFPVTGSAVGGLLYLGLGASVVAYFAWNLAIDRAGPALAALIYYLIPVFTAAGGALFLNERLGAGEIASMILIVGGTAVGTLGTGKQRDQRGAGEVQPRGTS